MIEYESAQKLGQLWDEYLREKFMTPSEVDEKIVSCISKAYHKLQDICSRRQHICGQSELIGIFCTCLRQEVRWLRED